MSMTRMNLFGGLAALALTALVGCGDDDDTMIIPDGTVTPVDAAVAIDAGGNPAAPTVGTQIERMGRPGVNTALTNPFFTSAMTAAHEAKQDAYNAAGDPATWKASFSADIKASLGVLDSLDNTCGNQFAAAATLNAARYQGLADVLADDQLYVKTNTTTCAQYLAVEADATGIIVNADCGGRKLGYDVIDTTYSALAIGALTGVGDGVPMDDNTVSTTFPYLAAPTN